MTCPAPDALHVHWSTLAVGGWITAGTALAFVVLFGAAAWYAKRYAELAEAWVKYRADQAEAALNGHSGAVGLSEGD